MSVEFEQMPGLQENPGIIASVPIVRAMH